MSTVKLGSAEDDYFKKYDRKFIQLRQDICMLIHLFKKDEEHSWEDIWLQDFECVYEKDMLIYEEAAKQFIDQLEGNWCISFLKALRNECDNRIEKDLEQRKTLINKENEDNNECV